MFTVKFIKEDREVLYTAKEVSYANASETDDFPLYEVSLWDAEGGVIASFIDGTVHVLNDIGLMVAEYNLSFDNMSEDDDLDDELEDDEDEA
jgi:hypothetical protein